MSQTPSRSVLLDTAVMHHPARPWLLDRILPHLPGCRVVVDPDPDGEPAPWRTHEACLATMHADASHLLIVQDDALPAPGFMDAAERAVAARPDVLVCFYVGTQPAREARKMRWALEAGERWLQLVVAQWCPTVALAWPRPLRDQLLADEKRHTYARRADDFMVGRWATQNHVEAWATVPSLVQHIDDQPSIAGRRWNKKWRQAAHVATDASAW